MLASKDNIVRFGGAGPKRGPIAAASAAAALLLAGGLPAQEPEDGRALFVANGCYQCHNYEGQGGAALRIAPSPYPFEAFARLVRQPPVLMPAYPPNLLSDEALRQIYEYVRSIPEPPPVEEFPLLNDLD